LFDEIESLEETIRDPDFREDTSEKSGEIIFEEVVEDPLSEFESELVRPEISPITEKKATSFFGKRPTTKIATVKKKRFPLFKKWKLGESKDQSEVELGELKPTKTTFTLKVTKQGGLIGFNVKKPKQKSEKKQRRIFSLKRKKSTEEKPEVKGIKGKLLGGFSKLKLKKSESSEGSKASSIGLKIKGIFSRKSKE